MRFVGILSVMILAATASAEENRSTVTIARALECNEFQGFTEHLVAKIESRISISDPDIHQNRLAAEIISNALEYRNETANDLSVRTLRELEVLEIVADFYNSQDLDTGSTSEDFRLAFEKRVFHKEVFENCLNGKILNQ